MVLLCINLNISIKTFNGISEINYFIIEKIVDLWFPKGFLTDDYRFKIVNYDF